MKLFKIMVVLAFMPMQLTANDKVAFPDNYQQGFTEYLSLDRTQNPDQFIRLFANDVAMKGTNSSGGLDQGSVLVAEIYSVKKDQQGKVVTSALGRRVKDKLLLVAVMEKQPGFGDGQAPNFNLHTGDWDFATYKPNGELAKKNLDACRACHAPLTQSDFLFSIEHLGN
ncbi:cytochrome P460 family protein [Shewanella corallii]|uniref:Cytochrome P460 family protein n=1 Tax=Shewanella corallii TaxID=560080 RepID=A0ABT0N1T3_9GAMM|nr:cytochrome P460 family protein [Shewanella corallii]MCL2912392.1 cytochrome P460 family protein [Shewanella corallii]